MIVVETANRSGLAADEGAAEDLARQVLSAEGVADGELGITFVGVDEATDVLSFPLDGREELPTGVPRALGDVVLCPEVVGSDWRGPLVHGLLHLLGYDHGEEMEAREIAYTSG